MTQAIKVTISSLIVVLFAFSLLFVGIRALGLASFVVTGGSMEPTIHKGSLVIDEPVTADKLRLGDVITFDHYDQTTTHRIVGVEGSASGTMFSTKGDANQVTDPEPLTFPGRVGLVKVAIPGLGYAVAWMQYIWRLGATLVAAIIFFSCAAMVFLRTDPKAAPVPSARQIQRRAVGAATLVPVRARPASSADAQRIWAEHERWLQQATAGAARAA
ncbi:MAG TPA: signal peptidase I [Candidatus Limnocylindria bacterium]|nr:signal peptidase I [Candidatus Limnocylindria bacterium]